MLPRSGHDKAAGAAVEADDDPWWKDALVLMLGAYTFLIIMVKTTLEYEYNVIVSETSTTEEMVALTGYLYAAAGTAASLMNLGGTRACLKQFGLSFASASYPLGLIVCSLAIVRAGIGRWSPPNFGTLELGRIDVVSAAVLTDRWPSSRVLEARRERFRRNRRILSR